MASRELDMVMAMLSPEVMLPEQWAEKSRLWTGERKLMRAVIEEAVGTLFRTAGVKHWKAERDFYHAKKWIASDDIDSPFSFVNCCEECGIDPGFLRSGIADAMAQNRRITAHTWKRTRRRELIFG